MQYNTKAKKKCILNVIIEKYFVPENNAFIHILQLISMGKICIHDLIVSSIILLL